MKRLSLVWQLLCHLGPRWFLFRGGYELRQKCGWNERRRPVSTWAAEPLAAWIDEKSLAEPAAYYEFRRRSAVRFFFHSAQPEECRRLFESWDEGSKIANQMAERIKRGEFPFFGRAWVQCGYPPDWYQNPFTGTRAPSEGHWSRINEFSSGDIKLVWELSRFGWVFALVRAYWRTGDESLAECFWQLVEDWRLNNPPQSGVNWKCGQEASFRVMAWCFGLYGFANAVASSPKRVAQLAQALAVQGRRIEDNLSYALSQSNNHGISEAAGLWTLGILFPEFRLAAKWRDIGKKALERQVRQLVYDDGGFSQHSFNYHRVMLEDYLWCIQLGRVNCSDLTSELLGRVGRAGKFLATFMEPESGRVPNWGSNDGAHVLPLTNCNYLDYRPVVQAAAMITEGVPGVSSAGPWDEEAWWLGVPVSAQASGAAMAADVRRHFPDSGLTVLQVATARAVLRTMRRFRHRPAQCDLLHLDLWNGNINVLRDSGSYSCNPPDASGGYFKSVAAHNTIQFDDHEQMPVLGRFLYGHWPEGDVSLPARNPKTIAASYSDWKGCRHERVVALECGRCHVTDRISGFHSEAVLRWHLAAGVDWSLIENRCASRLATIRVTAQGGRRNIRLVHGWESLFYYEKTPTPVLEVTLTPTCGEVRTEIVFD